MAGKTQPVLPEYEYKVVTATKVPEYERLLNEYGKQGFRVSHASVALYTAYTNYIAIMRKDVSKC